MFDDYFELRKSFYDGVYIQQLLAEAPYKTWFVRLCQIDVERVEKDYLLEGRPLANVLAQVQRYIQQCEQTEQRVISVQASRVLERLHDEDGIAMAAIAPEVLEELQMLVPDVYAALRVRLDKL